MKRPEFLIMQTETEIKPKPRASRKRQPKPQPAQETEIEKLVNLPVVVPAFGREYEIGRFSIFQLAQAMTYLGPLQYVVQEIADRRESLSQGQIASVIFGALSISGESMIGLVSVATSEPSEWIGEQKDEIGALRILTATLEKNAHFFSPENIEEYKALLGRLQQAIPALSGLTSTP